MVPDSKQFVRSFSHIAVLFLHVLLRFLSMYQSSYFLVQCKVAYNTRVRLLFGEAIGKISFALLDSLIFLNIYISFFDICIDNLQQK